MPLNPIDALLLADMRAAALAAQSFVREMALQTFLSSDLHSSAVERKLTVIGEAAGLVSSDIQRRYSHIEWGPIAGLRNKLVHDYFEVDSVLIWQFVMEDLPVLLKDIELIVASET